MGSLRATGVPSSRLTPFRREERKKSSSRGLGKPISRCNSRMAER